MAGAYWRDSVLCCGYSKGCVQVLHTNRERRRRRANQTDALNWIGSSVHLVVRFHERRWILLLCGPLHRKALIPSRPPPLGGRPFARLLIAQYNHVCNVLRNAGK